jgi:hypothetical protein
MTPEFPKRMPRRQASEYLHAEHGIRVAWQTLAKLAITGEGPAFLKDGRFPLYEQSDLDAWAEKRLGKAARSTAAHGIDQQYGGRPKSRETASLLTE